MIFWRVWLFRKSSRAFLEHFSQKERTETLPSVFVTPVFPPKQHQTQNPNIKHPFTDDDDSKKIRLRPPQLLAAPSTAARLTPHHHQVRAHCRGDAARQLERRADTRRATFRDLCPPRPTARPRESRRRAFSLLSDAGDAPPPSKPSVSATERGTTVGPAGSQRARRFAPFPPRR